MVPIELALARPPRCERSGFHLVQRHVPPELITTRGGLRVSSPALTALDLCQTREDDGIDRALFRRATTLAHLHHAMDLTPFRRGNIDRRRLLLDSRDEPWARSERLTHRLLRDHDIRGWKANLAVEIDETTMYLDVGFA